MHPKNVRIPPIIGGAGTPEATGMGYFMGGTEATIFFHFPDLDGNMYDPSDMNVTVKDPSSTTVHTSTALEKLDLGEYAFIWSIPATADTGTYTLTLEYTAETASGPVTTTHTEQFVVTETYGNSHVTAANRRLLWIRGFLESLVGEVMRIPVQDEQIRLDQERRVGTLSFPRWNQPAGANIYVNGELRDDGYDINWHEGTVTFDNPLASFDYATADYNFRWISNKEIEEFVIQGIQEVNIWPPQSNYNFMNIPDQWIVAADYAAARNIIRRLMMDLLFQEPEKVFGGPKRASEKFGHLDSLKKNYEESFKMMVENKKYQSYVGLTATFTVPVYTLPGGRSRYFRYMFKGAT